MKIAILDDYQNAVGAMPAVDRLEGRASVTTFRDHIDNPDELVARLADFDCILAMRERTPMPGALLERLGGLKLLVTTGMANVSIDIEAATRLGIQVCGTASLPHQTAELTWALILSLVRRIPQEAAGLRDGRWQDGIGGDLHGSTLGIVGLGKLGTQVASVANAFGMEVLAWSANLTEQDAIQRGARRVDLDILLERSDVITIHTRLSERSRGLIGSRAFERMKRTALLINTSRGPIVDEAALLDALRHGRIAGAGLDVFDKEPLPPDHPFRQLPNVLATPHIGYVTKGNFEVYFREAVEDIEAWLAGEVVRPLNAPATTR